MPFKEGQKNYCHQGYNAHKKEENEISKQSIGKFEGIVLTKTIVKNQNLINAYEGKYTEIVDRAIAGIMGSIMDNLGKNIYLFAEEGW